VGPGVLNPSSLPGKILTPRKKKAEYKILFDIDRKYQVARGWSQITLLFLSVGSDT